MHPLTNRQAFAGMAAALVSLAFLFAPAGARAQDLEPRSYVNTPNALNFAIVGVGHSEGKLEFVLTLPVEDAQYHTNTVAVGYAHSFRVWGKSAKFDVIVPYTAF